MNGERITIDTNILVYAMDIDAGSRHKLAVQVLERAINNDCLITLQALSEFFNTMTRKKKLSTEIAAEHVNELLGLFPIITAKSDTLKHAMTAVSKYKLAFWDAMLWATAQEAGVTILYSEDFQHGQLIGRVRIINPFHSK